MADTRTPQQRTRIMQAVGTENTGPEMLVRQALRRIGFVGYRLHSKSLPGKPDIAFKGRKKAIFVHGCFWHGHDCPKGRPSKSRRDYWGPKIEANRERDARKASELAALGFDVLTVWQCETKDVTDLERRLANFLGENESRSTSHGV